MNAESPAPRLLLVLVTVQILVDGLADQARKSLLTSAGSQVEEARPLIPADLDRRPHAFQLLMHLSAIDSRPSAPPPALPRT